ncbi:MAG TPA: PAS domain-containing protein [Pirellulales bacterium]|nr:PAS domain-containing protein [Pirellulales bacterium]
MQALVLLDLQELSELLVAALLEAGFEPIVLDDVATALKDFAAPPPALVVVGWGISKLDGLAACRQFRETDPRCRSLILIVTRHTTASQLQTLLDAGADDYLPYPSDPDLLRVRLQIAARRVQSRIKSADVELQLRNSIERFELAVRGANDGLWDAQPMGGPWDQPDTKVWYSQRMKQLLGYNDEEFPSVLSSWELLLHPDDRQRVFAALVEHIEHKRPYDIEYRLRVKSGEYRWFSARGQGVWDEQGRLLRMSGSLRDVTQSKEYEAKLEQSEAKWRSLVENAPDIIILTDLAGTIKFINRSTPGFKTTLGRSVYDYIDPEFWDAARQAHQAVCTTGQPQQYEALIHRPEGGSAWFAARLGPIYHNGRVESVVRIATDITHRKQTEEQLKREQQLLRRLLDLQERERQLVAYDIHDGLVQYLTGGLMHLEASAEAGKSRKGQSQSADFNRGLSLLRDALAEARRLISGLRPPILDEQGVAAALEYLVNESRPEIPQIDFVNLSYFGRLAAPLEVAIFRITQEGLSNIRQHSHSRRALVELLQHGLWVRLIIRDWGCGFDPSKVQEEQFGLQGIRQRARLLGTVATIETALGKGTIIVVDFPLVHDLQEELAAELPSENGTPSKA